MTASLGRCLCIDYPDAPLMATFGVVKLLDGLRKATQKIIESYCSRIPFFCSLLFLVDSRVIIGGAAKGRSSSKPLLRELRRTAALWLLLF